MDSGNILQRETSIIDGGIIEFPHDVESFNCVSALPSRYPGLSSTSREIGRRLVVRRDHEREVIVAKLTVPPSAWLGFSEFYKQAQWTGHVRANDMNIPVGSNGEYIHSHRQAPSPLLPADAGTESPHLGAALDSWAENSYTKQVEKKQKKKKKKGGGWEGYPKSHPPSLPANARHIS